MHPTTVLGAVDPTSTDILALANSPILWAFGVGVFLVIGIQSVLYVRAARKAGPEVGMEKADLNRAFRAGAVASIGPSLAVVIVAIALLAMFGTPAVLVRIGLIGSAPFETGAATISAHTMGAELGGESYTQQVFAVAFATMSLAGAGWFAATLLLTPLLKKGSVKLSQVNPVAMGVITSAALLGAFAALTIGELPKSGAHVVTAIVSAAVMALLLALARFLRADWLKEWALGISILVALTASYFAHSALVAG